MNQKPHEPQKKISNKSKNNKQKITKGKKPLFTTNYSRREKQ